MAALTPEQIVARARKDPKFLARAIKDPGMRSKLPDKMLTPALLATRTRNAQRKAPLADRAKRDPALLAKALANPGLRSKLPASMLPPELRKARETNLFNKDISDLSTPLSGDSLLRVARQLADRDYDQTIRSLGDEEKVVERKRGETSARTGGLFDDLLALAREQVAGSPAATADSVAAQRKIGDQARAQIAAAEGQAQQRASADAATRGADLAVSPQQIAAMAGTAASRTAEGSAAAQTNAQSQGDAMGAILKGALSAAAQNRVAAMSGVEKAAAEELERIGNDRRDAGARREGAFADALLKLRGDAVEQDITQQTLASKEQQAILEAKTELAKIKTSNELARWKARLEAKLKREGMSSAEARDSADRASAERRAELASRTSRANNKDTNASRERTAAKKTADKQKAGVFTAKEKRQNATKRDGAVAQAIKGAGSGMTQQAIYDVLMDEYGDVHLARVAAAIGVKKKIPANWVKNLERSMGITVPRRYRK